MIERDDQPLVILLDESGLKTADQRVVPQRFTAMTGNAKAADERGRRAGGLVLSLILISKSPMWASRTVTCLSPSVAMRRTAAAWGATWARIPSRSLASAARAMLSSVPVIRSLSVTMARFGNQQRHGQQSYADDGPQQNGPAGADQGDHQDRLEIGPE